MRTTSPARTPMWIRPHQPASQPGQSRSRRCLFIKSPPDLDARGKKRPANSSPRPAGEERDELLRPAAGARRRPAAARLPAAGVPSAGLPAAAAGVSAAAGVPAARLRPAGLPAPAAAEQRAFLPAGMHGRPLLLLSPRRLLLRRNREDGLNHCVEEMLHWH